MSEPGRSAGRVHGVGLAAALAAGFAARALGFEDVLLEDGSVALTIGDGWYHARRALLALFSFPHVPRFDPWLDPPHGAPIPYPPLYDLALAAAAHALGATPAALERVAAWAAPVFGTLTVLPVYALGRRLRGPALGMTAAWLYALLPLGVLYARVGNADHHAAVALLASVLLALYAAVLDERTRARTLWRAFAWLALARAALLGVWQGALLYLGPGELALLAGAAGLGRRDLLRGQAASAAASALLVAPLALGAETPVGGSFSAVELSAFHVLCLAAVAALAGGLAVLESWRPSPRPLGRVTRAAGLAGLLGAALLAVPQVRAGLTPALVFLGKAEAHAAATLEQLPLFVEVPGAGRSAAVLWLGWLAYAVPFVPLAFLLRPPGGRVRAPHVLLFAWSLLFAALALQQLRWGNEFAPVAALGFALGFFHLGGLLARWGVPGPGLRRGVVLGVALLALWPAASGFHAVDLRASLAHLRGTASGRDRALDSVSGTLVRFAEAVRAATPGPSERADPAQLVAPFEYAILCRPSLSHVLRYVALRQLPADSFGPYVSGDRYGTVRGFFALVDEAEALAVMERLQSRYLVTDAPGPSSRASLARRLHQHDGIGDSGAPAVAGLRLVTEGPAGGLPLHTLVEGSAQAVVPYKLFERVRGALLEVTAPPGDRVEARVVVETPTARSFTWRAGARAGPEGTVRLRVPYATRTASPARPRGPYAVSAGGVTHSVHVSDADVREGRTLRVDAGVP